MGDRIKFRPNNHRLTTFHEANNPEEKLLGE